MEYQPAVLFPGVSFIVRLVITCSYQLSACIINMYSYLPIAMDTTPLFTCVRVLYPEILFLLGLDFLGQSWQNRVCVIF